MMKTLVGLLCIYILTSVTCADYTCLCTYTIETVIYPQPSTRGPVLGYLYEFDCKETVGPTDGAWIPIAFKHKIGYIEKTSMTVVQVCQGEAPQSDILITTTTNTASILSSVSSSSTSETTTLPVTTSTSQSTKLTDSSSTRVTTTPISSTHETTTTKTTTTNIPTTTSSSAPATTTAAATTKTSSTSETITTTSHTSIPITTSSSTPATTTNTPTTTSSTPVTTTTFSTTASVTYTKSTTTLGESTSSSTMPLTSSISVPTSTQSPTASTTGQPETTTTFASTSTAASTAIPTTGYKYNICPESIVLHASSHNDHAFMLGHACYEIVPKEMTWYQAESDCKSRGGHLADVASSSVQSALQRHLQFFYYDTVWLGLHDHSKEDHFMWSSGSPVSYTNFMFGHRDPYTHGRDDCVMMEAGGRWDDVVCSEHFGYVCKFPVASNGSLSSVQQTTGKTTSSPSPATFTDGNTQLCSYKVQNLVHRYHTVLVQHGDSCYQLMHNKVTWKEGEGLCQKGDGHLVHINKAEEQNYLNQFLKDQNFNKAVWIGYHDLYEEGVFEWSDDEFSHYTNWMPGSYNNYQNHRKEDCVAMKPGHQGQWDDLPCDDLELHFSLCEYETVRGNVAASLVG